MSYRFTIIDTYWDFTKESEPEVLKIEESEPEVLKIEESESALLCTDSTALPTTPKENINARSRYEWTYWARNVLSLIPGGHNIN
jgi:hypothetical protein